MLRTYSLRTGYLINMQGILQGQQLKGYLNCMLQMYLLKQFHVKFHVLQMEGYFNSVILYFVSFCNIFKPQVKH